MAKKIICLLRRDIANGLKDNILLYILVFPIALAVIFSLLLPSLQGAKPTFAIDSNTGEKFKEKFKAYGNVEIYTGLKDLAYRVEQPDDVIGIYMEGSKYMILVEGNESGNMESITGSIIDKVTNEKPLVYLEYKSLGGTESPIRGISASMLALSAIIVAGLLISFNIVEEKETRFIRGLAVSPVTMFEYMASRFLTVLLVSVILAVLSSFVLVGFEIDYLRLVVGVLISGGFGTLLGLLIGGLADNQMSAIALMKILMLFIICIPIGSLFVPQKLQFVFYIFPHYWVFQVFQNVFTGSGTVLGYQDSCFSLVGVSIVFIAALVPVLQRKLKLR